LNQEYLKSILNYNENTGKFTWVKNGKNAGYIQKNGYVRFNFNNKHYRGHKLAWLYVNGELPDQHIDHIDGNPNNNAISNLRLCNRNQNMQNRKINKNNKLGIKGVCWNKKIEKYHVQIGLNEKVKHIGYFDNLEFAELVSIEVRNKYHKEFARAL
jgi:hypothetical protein